MHMDPSRFGFPPFRRKNPKPANRSAARSQARLGKFERLEDRALLSGTGLSDSIGLSWPTPIAGQSWTLTASVNGTLLTGTPRTGTLTLSEGGNTLASIDLSTATPVSGTTSSYALAVPGGLPLGSDLVTVAYSGDTNYSSASSSVTLNVTNDTLAISYSTQALTGQAYTVNAAINGALVNSTPRTGTLSLMEGSNSLASVDVSTATPNSSGYYALTVPAGLATGTHNLSVVYTGDSNYSALSRTLGRWSWPMIV